MFSKYFRLVKFSHTVFALPFALTGFAYALYSEGELSTIDYQLSTLAKIILCMIFARNAAMAFNRWADRKIDRANPRTADREIPAGKIPARSAVTFVAINAALFIATAATINLLAALLSPVALATILIYSYCKRFTAFSHLVLGLSLAIAPVGAYIAVTGTITLPPCLLALVVMTWCAGFDIIYALQDTDFDRKSGLHSIPAALGPRKALLVSALLHAATVAALLGFAQYCPNTPWLWTGIGIFTALLLLQHILVTPTKQRHIGIAFGTLNGLASLILAIFTIAGLVIRG